MIDLRNLSREGAAMAATMQKAQSRNPDLLELLQTWLHESRHLARQLWHFAALLQGMSIRQFWLQILRSPLPPIIVALFPTTFCASRTPGAEVTVDEADSVWLRHPK